MTYEALQTLAIELLDQLYDLRKLQLDIDCENGYAPLRYMNAGLEVMNKEILAYMAKITSPQDYPVATFYDPPEWPKVK